ncbi:MAG TPA: hypothetical protein PLB81_12125 [Deltaproteobacteria bacterium]|nr:hypothetical protein [Deltaproteobacteria bacterium]
MCLYVAAVIVYGLGMHRMAKAGLSAGIAVNLAALLARGYIAGRWYIDQMVMEDALMPAGLALMALYLARSEDRARPRIVLIPLAACAVLMLLAPKDPAVPFLRSQTLWAPLFFLTEIISVVLFITASALAVADLVARRMVLSSRPFILWGFIAFTICQIVGGVWAYVGWSYPFSWSDRHLASAAVWCLAAALLHADFAGVEPRIKAWCTALMLIPVVYLSLFNTLYATGARLVKVLS